MKFPKNINSIVAILNEVGIDDDDRNEVYTQRSSTGTYYTFKVYNPSTEDFFRLGSLLGETFGYKNVWIDTYLSTPKYRGYAKIEIKK
jgi:hypothetical protein